MWMLAILTSRLIPEELGTQFLWIVPERRKANPLSGVTSSDSTDTWSWKESGEPQRHLPSRLLRKSHLRNHQDRWTTTNTRLDMKNWIWATTRNSKLLLLFAKGLRTHFSKCRLRWRKLTAKLCRLVQGHLPFHIMIVFHKFVNFSGEMFLFSLTLKVAKQIASWPQPQSAKQTKVDRMLTLKYFIIITLILYTPKQQFFLFFSL